MKLVKAEKTQLEKKMVQLRYGCITIKQFWTFLINYKYT